MCKPPYITLVEFAEKIGKARFGSAWDPATIQPIQDDPYFAVLRRRRITYEPGKVTSVNEEYAEAYAHSLLDKGEQYRYVEAELRDAVWSGQIAYEAHELSGSDTPLPPIAWSKHQTRFEIRIEAGTVIDRATLKWVWSPRFDRQHVEQFEKELKRRVGKLLRSERAKASGGGRPLKPGTQAAENHALQILREVGGAFPDLKIATRAVEMAKRDGYGEQDLPDPKSFAYRNVKSLRAEFGYPRPKT